MSPLFMMGKIQTTKYKMLLAACSLIHAINDDLSESHAVVRFTTNLFVSVQLDNKKTKNKMLTILLYIKKRASLYPGIEILCQTDNPHDIDTAEHYNIFDYLLSYENPGLLMEFLLAYMELSCSCSFQANLLRVPALGRRIFKCLFADRSISRLEQLEAQMGAYWGQCVVECTWVNLSWLVYACEEGRAADEFIRVILRHIKKVGALQVEDSSILAYSYDISVGNLMSMKNALALEGNEKLECKFYKIVRALNAISTYCPDA